MSAPSVIAPFKLVRVTLTTTVLVKEADETKAAFAAARIARENAERLHIGKVTVEDSASRGHEVERLMRYDDIVSGGVQDHFYTAMKRADLGGGEEGA